MKKKKEENFELFIVKLNFPFEGPFTCFTSEILVTVVILNMICSVEDNARDFIFSGGVTELVRISMESTKEDIRNLAKKTLRNPAFQAEIQTRK